ncbi:hypothetical protein Vadar_021782 [Vaccinium darrowii]|uniref:Uncharacterized protein n=1 Tax=Vaccinium darrowii TaxID=229202 RepID=A0ACB7XS32_9ERIC|nr:hypothetical protein Vadar_021782 [Vaccinium darrowii]
MVLERLQEEEEEDDAGEPTITRCANHHHHHHPHKPTTTAEGICPFCLQEKLTKLLSSSSTSSFSIHPSTSSPPSPNKSFRSDFIPPKPTLPTSSLINSNITHHLNSTSKYHYHQCPSSGAFLQIPFVQTQKKKKNKNKLDQDKDGGIFSNRSKSTRSTPRGGGRDFLPADEYNTPRKRGLFWSLISLSRNGSSKRIEDTNWRDETDDVSSNGFVSMRKRGEDHETVLAEEENGESSQEAAASDRKVTRSRSVGCGGGSGSRSFSGEFFDRISTGFGDCALRRVESYRESKQKITAAHRRRASTAVGQEFIKCSGIFGGFMGTSSSSSSSSSSYLVSSSGEDSRAAAVAVRHGRRSKSWGWAFASPLRAFNKHSSYGKREGLDKKNSTSPKLNAMPSIMVFRG